MDIEAHYVTFFLKGALEKYNIIPQLFSQKSWDFHTIKWSKELKNGIEIFVCQEVFKLWIKTVKTMFLSNWSWPT